MTGAGVVSPLGIGVEALTAAPASDSDTLGAINGVEAQNPAGDAGDAFVIADFDPHLLLPGVKGLKSMSRTAQLACAAAELALGEARLSAAEGRGDSIGFVGGTVYGNVGSVGRFVHEVETEGPRFVDAMLFPNTVLNSAAGFASIAFSLTALNSTVNAGPATGLAALGYAARLLRRGRARAIVAGAYEELSPWLHLGFQAEGRLATGASGAAGRPLPFGRDRRGTVLGEGAALLVLETREGAEERGATAETALAGLAEGYAAGGNLERCMSSIIRRALDSAETEAADVGAVFVAASGDREFDLIEASALRDALGRDAFTRVTLVPLKALVGETSGAHGALAAAAAHRFISNGTLPRIPDYPLDPALGRSSLRGEANGGAALITCAGKSSSVAAAVLRRA